MSKHKNQNKNNLTQESSKTSNTIEKQSMSVSMQSIHISSPIPPPEIMQQYKLLMPDAMERFFQLAEKQGNHRQSIELINVKGQNSRANVGLIAAWTLTILFCLIGAFLIYIDKQVGAYTSFLLAVVPRVTSFYIARKDRKEQIKKHK